MAFGISKYAKALPSLLGLKERGQGPREFSDQVVGVIDLTVAYLLDGRELITTTVNVAPAVGSNGYPTAMAVPAGESWFVWAYSVSSAPGAGAAIDMAASCGLDGLPYSAPVSNYVSAAATQAVKTPPIVPFFAPAGTSFEFLVRSVTLAPSVTGQICITRLRQ
jgi:hypothetical protein